MYYFLKKENFNLSGYNFNISATPHLTGRQRELLSIFSNLYKISGVDYKYKEIKNPVSYFKKNIKQLICELSALSSKVINITVSDEKQTVTTAYFKLFSIIAFENDKLIYRFSDEIILAHSYGNLFNRIQVIPFLCIKNVYSRNFFKLAMRNVTASDYTTLNYNIQEFRKLINIPDDTYTRFYDLETKILTAIKKDMEKHLMPVEYEKIKSNTGKGSRIIGIKFKILNKFHLEINRDTNKLLKIYSDKISDFSIAYKNIYAYRKTHDYKDTEEYLKENLHNISGFLL